MIKTHRIAIIPGDGIGVEVTEAACAVLEAAAALHRFSLALTRLPWSCDYYLAHGSMMPEDGIELLRPHDAILLGAVGLPARVPDSISLHGLLLPIRKAFDLFVNARPHKLLPGIGGPLRTSRFDILCIRENTEGEYSGAGGRVHAGTPHEVAVETAIFTRYGVERILRYAFSKARRRDKRLCSVTKSNAQKHSMVFWDEITDALSREYPDVVVEKVHVDAAAARFVTDPGSLDVVVASNLFGDILTDLGAAIQGGLGLAASANLNPGAQVPCMFEPVHGSAPNIAGRGIANPLAAIWSTALMLDHLAEYDAARAILRAMEAVTAEGHLRTPDLGGTATTAELTASVIARLRKDAARTGDPISDPPR
jgi:tartrate dehydrogenase/decarboxylase / D-malate dehydrogenase